jgi:hypothetical protein
MQVSLGDKGILSPNPLIIVPTTKVLHPPKGGRLGIERRESGGKLGWGGGAAASLHVSCCMHAMHMLD